VGCPGAELDPEEAQPNFALPQGSSIIQVSRYTAHDFLRTFATESVGGE
jgi:hypothetical protein